MGKKLTLNQIIEALSDEAYIPKTKSQEFINSLIEITLAEINSKGKATITNFGSFTIVEVAERTGVNPKSGDPLIIPAHKRISFTPYKALEKKVNVEFDHLEATVVDADSSKTTETFSDAIKQEPSNESERLLDALISDKKQPEEALNESFEDNPFNFSEDDEPENTDSEIPEIDAIDELNTDADETIEEFTEDSYTESKAFKTPGRPERKSNSISPTVLLSVLAVFLIGVLAIWFFFLRSSEPTTTTAAADTENILNDPSAFENEQVLNVVSDANRNEGSETEESESQIIPMIAADVDLSENQGEVMSIENQEPQIEYERFTGISYSVNSGVWIYEISRQTYGNTRLWPLIFQANYTLANNPDLILPNIELNIPQLEGSTSKLTSNDYTRLAEAARYVAQAYENAGNADQAAAYQKAANWYETMR